MCYNCCMEKQPSEVIDELFKQIRLLILQIRETNPDTAEELKSLTTQLEDWVEKLVLDSLRLESLQSHQKKATKAGEIRSKKTGKRALPREKS